MATVTVKTTTGPGPAVRCRAQDTDRRVGARMRERRIMLGLTQNQLAELIGVTHQQAHKYEKGINRIASGRLYDIAHSLGVDVDYFLLGMGSDDSRRRQCSACCSSWRAGQRQDRPRVPTEGSRTPPRPCACRNDQARRSSYL
jgi:transcriptional regulator with XRE-family HTH domain